MSAAPCIGSAKGVVMGERRSGETEYRLYFTVDQPHRVVALREVAQPKGRPTLISREGERFLFWAVRPLGLKVVRK